MSLRLFCLLFFLVSTAWAVAPSVEWSRTFGGPYGDGAWSLLSTADGGYLLAGHTSSGGEGADLWMVKTDAQGLELWNQSLGGSAEDAAYASAGTWDGGYVIAGSTGSYGLGAERLWLLRLAPDGSLVWDRTFGGFASSSGEGGLSVAGTHDGGFVAAGYTLSEGAGGKDLWLLRTGADGSLLWKRPFGGEGDDAGNAAVQTVDGGFLVAGRTSSFGDGGNDIWLLKADQGGEEEWNVTIGGTGDDAGFALIEVEDGYVIAGRAESEGQGKRAVLVKADLRGNKLWESPLSKDASALALERSSDGGFLLAGHIEKDGKDAWAAKVGARGAVIWETSFGGDGDDVATSVVESLDGCPVVAGITDSYGGGAEDAWLVKLSPTGDAPSLRAASGIDALEEPQDLLGDFPTAPTPENSTQQMKAPEEPLDSREESSPATTILPEVGRPGWTGPIFPRFRA